MDLRPQQQTACSPQARASLPANFKVEVGNAGDHVLGLGLLRAVGGAPSAESFQNWLDEPSYEPADRLVIRREGRLAAHLQILFRSAWFEGIKFPMTGLLDLAVLPEFQPIGFEGQLLAAAEQAMIEEASVVSLVRTTRPQPLLESGWSRARWQGCSQANCRDVLSHLLAQENLKRRKSPQLKIRLWRHVELDQLTGVYRAAVRGQWGALHRSDPYWQWLLGRKAHSEIIVAIEGSDDPDHDVEHPPRIVGYAILCGDRIAELICREGYEQAGPKLLVRACQDALEQDLRTITVHAPANDPMHDLLVTAGGSWVTACKDEAGSLLCKLLNAERWIESLYPLLHARAKGAGVDRPCELGFETETGRYRIRLTRRSSRFVADKKAPADVRCDEVTLSNLLLGNADLRNLLERERLVTTSGEVAQTLAALFPPLLLWQSPFDLFRR